MTCSDPLPRLYAASPESQHCPHPTISSSHLGRILFELHLRALLSSHLFTSLYFASLRLLLVSTRCSIGERLARFASVHIADFAPRDGFVIFQLRPVDLGASTALPHLHGSHDSTAQVTCTHIRSPKVHGTPFTVQAAKLSHSETRSTPAELYRQKYQPFGLTGAAWGLFREHFSCFEFCG